MTSPEPASSSSSHPRTREIAQKTQSTLEYWQHVLWDAVSSGAWSYPFLGIVYLARNTTLLKTIAPHLLKFLLMSTGITLAMFVFTFVPQMAFCVLFSGPFAVLVAALLVLAESYVIVMFVAKGFFLAAVQDEIFDTVLLQKGHENLVSSGRVISSSSSSSGAKKLGKELTKPLDRFSPESIIRYIVSLPLNAIPAVGTVVFLVVNGMTAGPAAHTRYFQLKGFDSTRKNTFVEKRKGAYLAFGSASLLLGWVPFVGLLFSFTTTIGAALWASKLEKQE